MTGQTHLPWIHIDWTSTPRYRHWYRQYDTHIDTDTNTDCKIQFKTKNKLEKFEATQELIFFRNMYHRQYKFVFQNKPLVFVAEFCGKRKKRTETAPEFFSSNCDMTEKRLFGRTVIQKLIYKTFFFEHERTWFNQKKDIFYKKAFYYRYKKILWTKIRFSFKFSQHRLTL